MAAVLRDPNRLTFDIYAITTYIYTDKRLSVCFVLSPKNKIPEAHAVAHLHSCVAALSHVICKSIDLREGSGYEN